MSSRAAPCHPDRAYYARDFCESCYSKDRRRTHPEIAERQHARYLAADKEERRAYQQAWRERNRDRERARIRKWDREHPGRRQQHRLRFEYGLEPGEWERLYVQQAGRCQICARSDRELVVDHDHSNGRVRGLLCRSCNTAIGLLGDNAGTLTMAISYIGRTR